VSEAKGASPWLPAIAGGLIGSGLTAALLLLAAPQLIGAKMVRHGMLADPSILIDTSDALRQQQVKPVLAAYRQALQTPFGSSWKGAEKPDVVLVEFFDYACGFCRASNPDIERLLAEDKGLRVVYREYPILGPASLEAAKLSMAASRAGRFRQFHDALFAAGRPTPETLALAARAAGIPEQAGQDAAAESEVRRNYQMASQLNANGTPVFIVGDTLLDGAVGYDKLKQSIADARAAKS